MRQTGYAFLTGAVIILLAGCRPPQSNGSPVAEFRRSSILLPSKEAGGLSSTAAAQPVPETTLSETSTINDYLVYAALNNPELEAAFYRWEAAVERVVQDRSLPDPRLTYRYFIEQVETRVGAQQQAVGISQTVPWFNKRSLKGDAANEAAGAAWHRYEAVKLNLFYRVKEAYYEYAYLQRAIGILEENVELMKNFERVVRTRYQTAAAQHPDVIRAQVELGKLEDRLTALHSLQEPIAARLNAALNRPADTPIARQRAISEPRITMNDSLILDLMTQSNPELASLDYEIARSRTAIDLARKDYYPDITFGLEFIDTSDSTAPVPPRDSGQDPVIATVSLNLPIWREKLEAGVRQARYQHHASQRHKTDTFNRLNARLKMTLYEFRDAERKVSLYRDTLLPKAVESVKAHDASFRSGGSTFLDVIDAQRVMLEFELAYERALSNQAQRLAELEMLVGTQLPQNE